MNTLDEFRTARLHLVRIGANDRADFEQMYADPVVMATLGGVRTKAYVAEYLERQMAHWEQHGYGLWTVRDPLTGRFAGRGGLRHADVEGRPEVEISYAFLCDYWGRGWATELARACARIAFYELKRADLVCFTLPTNRASQRVMEKVGFRYERDIVHADLPHVLYRMSAAEWQRSIALDSLSPGTPGERESNEPRSPR
jgi:ribosomal-protein-alanine N-acetyltransferase